MSRKIKLAVILILILAMASSCAKGRPLAQIYNEIELTVKAEAAIVAFSTRDGEALRSQGDADLQAEFNEECLTSLYSDYLDELGALTAMGAYSCCGIQNPSTRREFAKVEVKAIYEHGELNFTLFYGYDVKNSRLVLVNFYFK